MSKNISSSSNENNSKNKLNMKEFKSTLNSNLNSESNITPVKAAQATIESLQVI